MPDLAALGTALLNTKGALLSAAVGLSEPCLAGTWVGKRVGTPLDFKLGNVELIAVGIALFVVLGGVLPEPFGTVIPIPDGTPDLVAIVGTDGT